MRKTLQQTKWEVRKNEKSEERATGLTGQLVVSSRKGPPFEAEVERFLLHLTQCGGAC